MLSMLSVGLGITYRPKTYTSDLRFRRQGIFSAVQTRLKSMC